MAERITKAELARRLGVSKPRVSQYIGIGMSTLSDGAVDYEAAVAWIGANIADRRTYQLGRRMSTGCITRVTPATNTPSRSRTE